MNKETVRQMIRAQKALLDASEKMDASRRVFSTLRNLAAFMVARNVLLYHSLPDELSTRAFLDDIPEGKRYFLPRVNGLNLEILPYDRSRMHLGAFQIEEPDGDESVNIDDIDLIIVPALAYDRKGNRVGRGKGYYDRLLANSRATTIGVCYNFQLVDEIDTDDFDIPVDYVIADQCGIIRGRAARK